MSVYIDRTTMCLHNMVKEMMRKNIELSRIIKCSTLMILSGVSPNSIPRDVLDTCLKSQNTDGGFVANSDTIWKVKFMSNYKGYEKNIEDAVIWLNNHRTGEGFGRSNRDMGRIPVTGIAFYLLPRLGSLSGLKWLENLWLSEKNSLTYKAGYTLMAFSKNDYKPKNKLLIEETIEWLESQQEEDGGFAPWKEHPVGSDIYCTSISILGLLSYPDSCKKDVIKRAYNYIIKNQLKNGLWRYHELEDGASWGLLALTEIEKYLNNFN